ncbi:unnamed protein product [Linum tenue]|uniref:Uncharacterized protein n=1 Tax=Linum tenue TaxID=586396 RepID=A0AAV0GYB6_9ROSI|nr:unnamed protein product [Linum tenue]
MIRLVLNLFHGIGGEPNAAQETLRGAWRGRARSQLQQDQRPPTE